MPWFRTHAMCFQRDAKPRKTFSYLHHLILLIPWMFWCCDVVLVALVLGIDISWSVYPFSWETSPPLEFTCQASGRMDTNKALICRESPDDLAKTPVASVAWRWFLFCILSIQVRRNYIFISCYSKKESGFWSILMSKNGDTNLKLYHGHVEKQSSQQEPIPPFK